MVGIDSSGVPRVRTLGRYELFAKLGSGGMAEVHLARQRGLKRFRKLVVVKTVHPQLARDDRFVDLLLDEARISALLKHPRVVDIYDVDEDDGVVFIAMEYLPGQSVTEIIKAGRKGTKLDVLSSARIIADAAEGLEAAHNLRSHTGEDLELVHRDVSPGNIVVLYTGEVKLVDFGVAKARDHLTGNSAIGKFAGKLGYAAPEQLDGGAADRRSDVFSLGVVLWELLCHRRLFSAKTREEALALVASGKAPKPSSIRDGTPKALDDICDKALRPDPDERYESAQAMYEALKRVLRAGDYRRDRDTIATYMDTVFADERAETEALVRRISESTSQISIAQLDSEDAATTIDEALPEKIAAAELEGDVGYVAPASPANPAAQVAGPTFARRVTGVFRTGHPMRQPVLIGIGAVAAILVIFVLFEFATTGAKPATRVQSKATEATTVAIDAGAKSVPLDAAIVAAQALDAAVSAPLDAAPIKPDEEELAEKNKKKDRKDKKRDKKKDEKKEKKEKKKDDDNDEDTVAAAPVRDRDAAKENYRAGLRAIRSGDMGAAREMFGAALKADPGYAPAHRGLGVVYKSTGKTSAAVKEFRRYLRLRPNAKDADRIRKTIADLEGK